MKHDEHADRLEAEADGLEEHGEQVGRRIDEARSDWRSKQSDQGVPGAVEAPSGDSKTEAESEGENPDADSGGPA